MQGQRAEIDWRDGVPVARAFGDPYFSLADGLAETRHVFLAGNGLPGRFVDGFRIAELGFGTGLNLLATIEAWRAAGVEGRFRYTSFEAFPMAEGDRTRALAAFPEVSDLAEALAQGLALGPAFDVGPARVEVLLGDVAETLPTFAGPVDAWFLDGFAPDRNPAMWTPEVLNRIAAVTTTGGTYATYTAAGHVRRSLEAAGFAVERVPGFGRKRHMTRGVLR